MEWWFLAALFLDVVIAAITRRFCAGNITKAGEIAKSAPKEQGAARIDAADR